MGGGAEKQELIGALAAHESPVRSLSFHVRGELLASGSEDGTVRLWVLPGD